jgi:hypothetical protein
MLHREPFARRSKFLKAASSDRWTSGEPVDLTEHEPEVFASYMKCVYYGSVTVPELPGHVADNPFKGLITLYLLADKLNDAITANLVADEIIHMSEELDKIPNSVCVNLAFQSTVIGSPLRKLCRDYYAHEATVGVLEDIEGGSFPSRFVKHVLLECERLAKTSGKVKCVNREKCYYHQHDHEHPKCS